MKTKNQTEHDLLELAVASAANEDGFPAPNSRDADVTARNQGWSPYEVWRTRVKSGTSGNPAKSAQI